MPDRCGRRDSNPHGLPQRCLRPQRLPFRHARIRRSPAGCHRPHGEMDTKNGPRGPLHRQIMWSGRRDSNPRPSPWQGDALPLSHFRITTASRLMLREFSAAVMQCQGPFGWTGRGGGGAGTTRQGRRAVRRWRHSAGHASAQRPLARRFRSASMRVDVGPGPVHPRALEPPFDHQLVGALHAAATQRVARRGEGLVAGSGRGGWSGSP